jgi:uncharacterized circularly permuted ATP-grasp superfamily protein
MYGLDGSPAPRPGYDRLKAWLDSLPEAMIEARRRQAELFFRRIGITFAVYGQAEAGERLIPFDLIPRILTRPEWERLERGLVQRVTALNAFLADIYGPRECLRAGVIPEDLVYQNPQFQLHMAGLQPPHGIHVHLAGIDLVRVGEDESWRTTPAHLPASPT